MPSVEIELNGDGIRELLGRDDVRDMLLDKAERVRDAARAVGQRVEWDDSGTLPVEVVDASTPNRARALVVVDHPAARAVESKHRLLGRSLDAAR